MNPPGSPSVPAPVDQRFQEILKPLETAFQQLDAYLLQQVEAFEPEVQPLVAYCLGHSGKKLRPLLVFATGMEAEGPASDELVRAAAIVELVHLATLVHDDILDEAGVRHRTETLVARHGSHAAVLLGDALFSHALHLASGFPDVEVCRTVSLATRQVCSGEIAQTFVRGEAPPTPEAYFRMIQLKTAELFVASASLGAYLAGFSTDSREAARQYALHLGTAYQIYDDAADIFGEELLAGKTLGTDLATGKLTLPILLWLEILDSRQRASALADLQSGRLESSVLRETLLRAHILEPVREAFFERIQSARAGLPDIPSAFRRDLLCRLAGFLESAWNKFSIR